MQVTDVPLQDLPQNVKHILESYAANLDVQVVSQFVQRLIDAVLETIPEGNNKQAPKAKVCNWQAAHAVWIRVLHQTALASQPVPDACALHVQCSWFRRASG